MGLHYELMTARIARIISAEGPEARANDIWELYTADYEGTFDDFLSCLGSM